MREYAKVAPTFWTGRTGRALRQDPIAQRVALYLVTCPDANMIGLYPLALPTMAHHVGVTAADAEAAMARLAALEFAHYDHDTETVWVVEMARIQVGEKLKAGEKPDKKIRGVAVLLESVKGSPFVAPFVERYGAAYHLTEAPSAPPPKPHGSPFDGASGDAGSPLQAPPKQGAGEGAGEGDGARARTGDACAREGGAGARPDPRPLRAVPPPQPTKPAPAPPPPEPPEPSRAEILADVARDAIEAAGHPVPTADRWAGTLERQAAVDSLARTLATPLGQRLGPDGVLDRLRWALADKRPGEKFAGWHFQVRSPADLCRHLDAIDRQRLASIEAAKATGAADPTEPRIHGMTRAQAEREHCPFRDHEDVDANAYAMMPGEAERMHRILEARGMPRPASPPGGPQRDHRRRRDRDRQRVGGAS